MGHCGKVMFFTPVCHSVQRGSMSRGVSVRGSLSRGFLFGEGGYLSRVLCPGGLCPGESLCRGVSVQRGLGPGRPPYSNLREVCILLECILVNLYFNTGMFDQTHDKQNSLCPGGSLSGSLSSGSLSRGGLCPGRTPHTVTCGRYASYWNAFL